MPDSYTPVDLKADMLIYMKKNQTYVEVIILGTLAPTTLNFSGERCLPNVIELITLFFPDIAVTQFEDSSKHDI